MKKKIYIDAAGLRVYEFGTSDMSDIVVLPATVEFESATYEVQADGKVHMGTEVTVVFGEASRSPSFRATNASSWTQTGADCLARSSNRTGWIDQCWTVYGLLNDRDGARDFYQLDNRATAKSALPLALQEAIVWGEASSTSSPQSWIDWFPREDMTGSCPTSVDIGIDFGASLTLNRSISENWDITKYATPGKFQNRWWYTPGVWGSERSVSYTNVVAVPQGGIAAFRIGNSFFAW